MIRALHLIHDFNVEGTGGGLSRFGISLSKKQAELGLDVGLAALWQVESSREESRLNELHPHGVRTYVLGKFDERRPTGCFLDAIRRLRTIVRQEKYAVVHSHTEFCDIAMLGTLLSPAPPKLYRTVQYGYAHEWRKRPERRLIFTHTLLPLLLTKEIGVNPAIFENLNRRPLARLLGKKSLYIPNALDIERFKGLPADARARARASLALAESDIVFGSVGRLSVQKGFPFFIEAAAQVLAAMPDARFVIAGEGEDEEALRAQIHRLGLGERFRLLGPVAQIEQFFPALDFFVSSSLWEGLPTVIMEAFAARVPVIATDVAGSNVLVRPGETGWLCAPGSAESLAAAMLAAWREGVSSPIAVQEHYLEQAWQHVQAFSVDAIARQYIRLYQSGTV